MIEALVRDACMARLGDGRTSASIIGAALDRLVSELRERSIDAPGPAVTVVHVTVLKNGLKPPRHFRFTRA